MTATIALAALQSGALSKNEAEAAANLVRSYLRMTNEFTRRRENEETALVRLVMGGQWFVPRGKDRALAIRAIRRNTGCTLLEAKKEVDRLVSGPTRTT